MYRQIVLMMQVIQRPWATARAFIAGTWTFKRKHNVHQAVVIRIAAETPAVVTHQSITADTTTGGTLKNRPTF